MVNRSRSSAVKSRLSPARLRWSLLILLATILIPLLVLIFQTQQQMKWEAFYQQRLLAEELARDIDIALQQNIAKEEAYGYADYQFFIPAGEVKTGHTTNLVQQSTLAKFPLVSELPGLIGYFQVDDEGVFSTPLLPVGNELSGLNIAVSNIRQRQELSNKLLNILSQNQLVKRVRQQENRLTAELNGRPDLAQGTEKFTLQDNQSSTWAPFSSGSDPASSSAQGGNVVSKNRASSTVDDSAPYPNDAKTTTSEHEADEVPLSKKIAAPETDAEASKVSPEVSSIAPPSMQDESYQATRQGQPKLRNSEWKSADEPMIRDETANFSQQVFDQLSQRRNASSRETKTPVAAKQSRVEDLNISKEAFTKSKKVDSVNPAEPNLKRSNERISRKEQTTAFEKFVEPVEPDLSMSTEAGEELAPNPSIRVKIFESELDPFEMALLDSGEFVLFRNVWREGKRYIQGALLDQSAFIRGTISRVFQMSALFQTSDLVVAWQGNVLTSVPGVSRQHNANYRSGNTEALSSMVVGRANELSGTLLHQTRLSDPLGDFELLWTINDLPAGPGARIVGWSSLALLAVLLAGFTMIYWLGMKQIRLNRQQQDFVSAVSHELKTPLTSIRMYGEMLREGWVTEEKKREYYDFIHDESERLSRLITNVLQLARMERNDIQLDIKPVKAGQLVDIIRSKINTQVEKAGFHCRYSVHYQSSVNCQSPVNCQSSATEKSEEVMVDVDIDAFSQIVINIIDNALKFAAKAEQKEIDISLQIAAENKVIFGIRDYGPGIPPAQMRKIFDLFYRPGNELTRDTIGTGIGLALVRQLSLAMGGKAEVVNKTPGAEFLLILPNTTK